MSSSYEGRHRTRPVRPQGRHRATATKGHQLRRIGVPTGVAVAATVGGAVVAAGLTPTPVGGRNLAIDRSPYDASSAASVAKANAAKPNRVLPGTVSRGNASGARPKATSKPKAKSTPKSKPKPTSKPTASKAIPKPKKTLPPKNPWTCAVNGCAGPMVSGFGARVSPGGIGSIYHQGDDFAIAWGTPLQSMHDGTVVSTGWVDGLGIHVTIDYGDGIQSVYGHMSRVQVYPGQRVARGQLVGHSGNTGNSTGPHLHLEIHLGGVPVDPAPWLQARGIF
ncbi:M23 family metallopeptidase [Flexivirga sp. B27]